MRDFVLKGGMLVAPEEITELTVFPGASGLTSPVRFDMGGMKSINSYGIRHLIQFVRDLSGLEIEYHNCPAAFVETLNVVRELLGPKKSPEVVKSLAVPFYCGKCDLFQDLMVERAELDPDLEGLGVTAPPCKKCQTPMQLDFDEDDYLGFLT